MKLFALLVLVVLFKVGYTTDTDNSVDMLKYFCPSAQAIVTSLKGEVSSAVVNLDSKVDGLKTNVDELKTNVDGSKTNVEGLKTNVDRLKTNIDGLKTNIDGLKTNVDGLKANIASTKTKVIGLETNVNDLKTNSDGLKTNIDGLKTNVNSVKTNVDALNSKADTTAITLGMQTEALVALQSIVEDLKAQMDQFFKFTTASLNVTNQNDLFVRRSGDCELAGNKFEHHQNVSLPDCGFKCLATSRCKSFSYSTFGELPRCYLEKVSCKNEELRWTDDPRFNHYTKIE